MTTGLFDTGHSAGGLLHEWTATLRAPVAQAAPPHAWSEALSGPEHDLRADPAPASALATFAARQSIRQYDSRPLSAADLGAFLALATPPYAADEAPFHGLRPLRALNSGLSFMPLIFRDGELSTGLYRYLHAEQRLASLRAEDPLPVFKANCYQQEFVEAAALVMVVGSIHDSISRYGDRGYRYLLLDAGRCIQRCYAAAASLGLVGSIMSSFMQQKVGSWMGLDGYHTVPLVGFAIGYPQAEGPLA